MSKKTLELSNKQYRTLIKLLYIGEWTLNADHIEPPYEAEADFVSSIYAQCEKFGAEDLVNVFEVGVAELNDEVVQGILPVIDEYVESSFWPKLASGLATRDLAEAGILDENVDEEELEEKLKYVSDQYIEIFAETGLADLRLTQRPTN